MQKIKLILKHFIYILGFSLILMTISLIFKKNIYVDNSYYGFWCLLISTIIYLLNKTIKPILFKLTLPITGLTLGLFYPFINVLILYFTSLIMGNHFKIIGNIFIIFFIAVIISIMKLFMNELIKWLFRKEK